VCSATTKEAVDPLARVQGKRWGVTADTPCRQWLGPAKVPVAPWCREGGGARLARI
jgi:hypothetical protein